MSLMIQAYLLEKYGPRLSIEQLAEVLSIKPGTLYNQVSAGTCTVRTYVDGGRRWADVRDVAEAFDRMRSGAA
ncbi:MAG TPA: hypothetical protein VIN06_13605 [Devosia sp.]